MLNPALSQTLKIGGSGALSGMLRQIAPEFEALTGMHLQVVPGLGTTGGNAAAAEDVLGISVAGRPLKAKEAALGLTIAATFRTPFGLVTQQRRPQNFRSADIAELYRARKPTWSDGTSILIILRPAEESDSLTLGELFPGMSEAIKHLRTRTDLSTAATDEDNADMAERIKGSMVAATLTQIMTEKRNLRFVAIDGVAPSLENYENGSYPYAKTLYLVAPAKISPEASAFLAFIATPAGEALLRKSGIIAGAK